MPATKPSLKDVLPLEYGILTKYKPGIEIDEKDRQYIEDLACVGLMRMGIDFEKGTGMAITSDIGLRLLE